MATCHPERGRVQYATNKPQQNDPRRVELTIVALAQLSGKKCLHFLRVWDAFRYSRLVPLVTNKQFFAFKKEHQTRLISLNLLSQVSVLLRTAHRGQYRSKSVAYLCRYAKRRCRFGTLGARAFSSPQNFDSPFGLPQDDTLTLPGGVGRAPRKNVSLNPSASRAEPDTSRCRTRRGSWAGSPWT